MDLEARRESGGTRRRSATGGRGARPGAVGEWARLEFPNEDPVWAAREVDRRVGDRAESGPGVRRGRWRWIVRRTLRPGR